MPEHKLGDGMKTYRIQRKYDNVIEILVWAKSETEALRLAEEDFDDYEWNKFIHKYTDTILGVESNATAAMNLGFTTDEVEATTPLSIKIAILAELWIDYREETGYTDLMAYGDLGFPLAYAIVNEIAKPTALAEKYVEELWGLLLAGLDIEDDGEFETLSDLFDAAPNGGKFSQE